MDVATGILIANAALTTAIRLIEVSQKFQAMLAKAEAEGRKTFTDAERDELKAADDAAKAHLEALLNAAK